MDGCDSTGRSTIFGGISGRECGTAVCEGLPVGVE